ncbi:MAG: lipid-binding SYLF domain-containing protein [Bryobacteraceae bacterium]|nr:lipid-binding SYLF domain-containing protein [Bryobacteraceae bacterium]
MKLIPATLLLSCVAFAATDTENRINAATSVLQEIMATSDKAIPQDLLDKAECAIVIPGMKKGAFIVGAKFGRGFMSCRTGGAGWSAPAGVRIEGGSVGFQIGGSETDVVMLVLNKKGSEKLLESKFTLGGDVSVAAGPVGRTSTAETDALMRAEILSWSRSRGVFAGISLKGSTMRGDENTNKDLYGKELTARDIVGGQVTTPQAGEAFIALLTKYSGRK